MTAPVRVVALVVGAKCRARIRGGVVGRADVRFCDLRGELVALAATAHASCVIAEPRDRAGEDVSPAVSALRAGMPSVPVIAYFADDHVSSGDILAMARAGVHDLVRAGFDDVSGALRTVLASATAACAAAAVRDARSPIGTSRTAWPTPHCWLVPCDRRGATVGRADLHARTGSPPPRLSVRNGTAQHAHSLHRSRPARAPRERWRAMRASPVQARARRFRRWLSAVLADG